MAESKQRDLLAPSHDFVRKAGGDPALEPDPSVDSVTSVQRFETIDVLELGKIIRHVKETNAAAGIAADGAEGDGQNLDLYDEEFGPEDTQEDDADMASGGTDPGPGALRNSGGGAALLENLGPQVSEVRKPSGGAADADEVPAPGDVPANGDVAVPPPAGGGAQGNVPEGGLPPGDPPPLAGEDLDVSDRLKGGTAALAATALGIGTEPSPGGPGVDPAGEPVLPPVDRRAPDVDAAAAARAAARRRTEASRPVGPGYGFQHVLGYTHTADAFDPDLEQDLLEQLERMGISTDAFQLHQRDLLRRDEQDEVIAHMRKRFSDVVGAFEVLVQACAVRVLERQNQAKEVSTS